MNKLSTFINHGRSNNHYLASKRQNDKNAAGLYLFDDLDLSDEELTDNGVEFELNHIRNRNSKNTTLKKNPKDSTDFVIHTIKEGDTLQSLSLLYEVPVGEIKRVNNLINNQDFFGLKTVKIPTHKYGLLLELQEDPQPATLKAENAPPSYRTLSISQYMRNEKDEAKAFLQRMDEDLSRLREAAANHRSSIESMDGMMPNTRIHSLVEDGSSEASLKNDGPHTPPWQIILFCIIFGCVIAPLLGASYYVFYYEDQSSANSNASL